MTFGKIYTYPNNVRVAKIMIAAKYNGLELEEADFQMGVTNKSPEFLAKFPLGKVPGFEQEDGFTIFESNAIAQYVAAAKEGTKLLGSDKKSSAKIHQWIGVADNELTPATATWLYPIFGWVKDNKEHTEKAKVDIKRAMAVINEHLKHNTFLVGESITLADITLCCALLNFYKMVFEPSFRAPFKNVTRWFMTCINQPEFKSVIGEVPLCEKMQIAKKEVKSEKKEKKPKEKAVDSPADIPAEPKPAKSALESLPKSPFVIDEWKRFYSNNETRPDAVDWFWQKFDPEGWSIWKVDYKYNDELAMTFMSSNLVGGFFQRLERARKYAFGSLCILGEDNKNEIAGYFVIRGPEVPFEVSDTADYPSFTFTKVDHTDAKVKENVNAYFAWDEKIDGKPFADGKIFK